MTTKRISRLALLVFMIAVLPVFLGAATLATIGSPSAFTDGANVAPATFLSGVAGQPAPFNAIIGSDGTGPNFSATFSFNYAPVSVPSATITIGIWDNDAAAAGNQVASFTEGSVNDLTTPLNTAFEGHGGTNNEYDVYTITLPPAVLPDVNGGTPSFTLTLQGPGIGALGATPFNGAGLAFARLDSVPLATVPEPGTWAMLLTGIGAITMRRLALRRR
jgi:hypothetical protein